MTANSPYKTLSSITSAVLTDAKSTTSTQMVALCTRWINEAIEQVTFRKKRDWLDQQFTVQLNAAVQEACTVTNGSAVVTFTAGTLFPAGVELQFTSQEFPEVYNVVSSTLNVVTLDKQFLGTSNTAANGTVFQSSILLDPSIRTIYQTYHQHSSIPLRDQGPQEMRALQEQNKVQLGYATDVSIFGQSAGSRRMLLYPYPKVAYTLYMDANTFAPVLSLSTDEPSIPMQYRQILYWYASYKLFLFMRNESMASAAVQNFSTMLAKIDAEMRAELDFPQIIPQHNKRPSLTPFNPIFRSNT